VSCHMLRCGEILALACIGLRMCSAQTPSGALAGIVFDPSGARIPNVTLKLTHRELAVERRTITTAEGLYSSPALPPGAYDLQAEAPGFQPVSRSAVVTAGATTTVDLTLPIAPKTDSVDVYGAAPGLQRLRLADGNRGVELQAERDRQRDDRAAVEVEAA